MAKKVPAQKPGQSVQSVATPLDFITAVKRLLDIEEFFLDLAADCNNTKAPLFFSEEDDSLVQDWSSFAGLGWCWLNPPFTIITLWAAKCASVRDSTYIAFLVPASVGSNWFRDHVDGKAAVKFLNGRIKFEGHATGYPKDCILCLFGPDIEPGYEVWDWN